MPPDISAATWTEADASNTTAPPDGWPEGQLPSTVNNSARMMMGAIKRFRDRLGPIVVSTGTANAQILTYGTAPTAYVVGDVYSFIVGAGLTNTGATTVDINGLGAKNILLGTTALAGAELRETQYIQIGFDGTQFQLLRGIVPATGGFTPANPTGTTSAPGLMMGIGGTCTITPAVSGDILISLSGYGSSTPAADRFTLRLRYGTGTAPVNGAALTGTTIGAATLGDSLANGAVPFCIVARVTGLTVATAYWIDVSLAATGGNTVSVAGLAMVVEERPR